MNITKVYRLATTNNAHYLFINRNRRIIIPNYLLIHLPRLHLQHECKSTLYINYCTKIVLYSNASYYRVTRVRIFMTHIPCKAQFFLDNVKTPKISIEITETEYVRHNVRIFDSVRTCLCSWYN